jgi:hypothetical protein
MSSPGTANGNASVIAAIQGAQQYQNQLQMQYLAFEEGQWKLDQFQNETWQTLSDNEAHIQTAANIGIDTQNANRAVENKQNQQITEN